MLLLLCATLAGADDFVEIQLWGEQNLASLRRLRPYEHGIPSHDTLGEVIRVLDPGLFKAGFTAWVAGLRADEPDVVAVDGKTSRRTHARKHGREPLHLASAWASRQRLVLGQVAVADQSNEITAIPLLLERLELTGALVTIDAIGAQDAIAATIVARGGADLLALKANRPATFAGVAALFDDPPPGALDAHATTDGDHGRIEVRRHAVCHDVARLFSDRRHPGEVACPSLAMIGMVESTTERDGKTTHERRYNLSSAKLDAGTFARAVRAHWQIENRLHWVLDVAFRDDLARLRTGHGPENMAVVTPMALNLLRQAKPAATSLKNRASSPAGTSPTSTPSSARPPDPVHPIAPHSRGGAGPSGAPSRLPEGTAARGRGDSMGAVPMSHRSTRAVFESHLDNRVHGRLDRDLDENYADDVVLLTVNSELRGRDALRTAADRLACQLPDARFTFSAKRVVDSYAFLVWRAESDTHRVECGADSFVVRDGRFVLQTIHYRLLTKGGEPVPVHESPGVRRQRG